jgi:hypothetical protein
MPCLSITRLKLKSPHLLLPFLLQTEQVIHQIRTSPGFLQGKLLATLDLSMWTATLWVSEANLRSFYQGGTHRHAMTKLSLWASEATSGHSIVTTDMIPSWEEMAVQLGKTGRSHLLQQPSMHHIRQVIPPPKFKIMIRRIAAIQHVAS